MAKPFGTESDDARCGDGPAGVGVGAGGVAGAQLSVWAGGAGACGDWEGALAVDPPPPAHAATTNARIAPNGRAGIIA
jgi:hypothetical protein